MHNTRTLISVLLLITLFLVSCLFTSCSQVNNEPSVVVEMSQVESSRSKSVLILEKTADAIKQNYVFPEKGRIIAERLRVKTRAGGYSQKNSKELADAVNADLKQWSDQDQHLWLDYHSSIRRQTTTKHLWCNSRSTGVWWR